MLEDDFGAGTMGGESGQASDQQGPWSRNARREDMRGDRGVRLERSKGVKI